MGRKAIFRFLVQMRYSIQLRIWQIIASSGSDAAGLRAPSPEILEHPISAHFTEKNDFKLSKRAVCHIPAGLTSKVPVKFVHEDTYQYTRGRNTNRSTERYFIFMCSIHLSKYVWWWWWWWWNLSGCSSANHSLLEDNGSSSNGTKGSDGSHGRTVGCPKYLIHFKFSSCDCEIFFCGFGSQFMTEMTSGSRGISKF